MACDIAIIGQSFRFPGCADDAGLDEILATGLRDGVSPIRLPSPERWPFHRFVPPADMSAWHKPSPCGMIDAAFDFDPAPFSISPREAKLLDPQHRMALELAFLAQEEAGYGGGALSGTRTGVFVGTTRTDYTDAISGSLAADDYFVPLSNCRAALSNRISSVFDLHGPSFTLDTLCSSSFVAVHQACRALRAGDCDTALAGGVNILMSPSYFMVLRRLGLMSASGACRPFSSGADGFVPAEGGAMLCLKRLEDARADRDPIRAVIRGSGIVHHGQSNGLTVPDAAAMAEVMRRALADAGLDAEAVGLVQAMGASNALGDRAELDALEQVFAARSEPVAVSCEKGALGHLEPASGMAGLASALSALEQGGRYPVRGGAQAEAAAHPHVRVVAAGEAWSGEGPRRAGVSSFGMTGTHVHLVLEAAPAVEPTGAAGWMIFPVAAETAEHLGPQALDYADALAAGDDAQARDACFTAAVGRRHGRFRAAVVAPDEGALRSGLRALAAGATADKDAALFRGIVDARASAARPAPGAPDAAQQHTVDRASCERAAQAFVAGEPVDWSAVQSGARRRVRIPTTRLNRRTFLYDPGAGSPSRAGAAVAEAPSVHPLLRGARKG